MNDDHREQYTSSPAQWRDLKSRAREMRHKPTPAEDHLWAHIRNRQIGGVKFRRQHSIEWFVVDFICIAHKLIIEVDGSVHNEPDQQQYDQERQLILEAKGFNVLRFTNTDVMQSLDTVLETIRKALTSP